MKRLNTVLGALAALALVAGCSSGELTPVTSKTSSSAEAAEVVVADGCRVSAAHYVQLANGFTPDHYVVGKIDDKLPGTRANRGGAFSSEAVTTKDELRKQLNSGSPEAAAVIADVKKQVEGKATSAKKIKDTDNWVSVQYTVAVVWPENTTFVGGKAKSVGALDNGKVGEVSWIYVSDTGCKLAKDTKTKTKKQVKAVVAQTASKRGACLNGKSHPVPADKYIPPQTHKPRPPQTHKPRPPQTHKPPTTKAKCVDPGPNPPSDGRYKWRYNKKTCTYKYWKPYTSRDDQHSEKTKVKQPGQSNDTAKKNGAKIGTTKDPGGKDVAEPEVTVVESAPNRETDDEAPAATENGTSSGSEGASDTPSGSDVQEDGDVVVRDDEEVVDLTPNDDQADELSDEDGEVDGEVIVEW